LITFIELIKNPRFNFWKKGFTRMTPEIERVFESVSRSCMAASERSGSQSPSTTDLSINSQGHN
jgi:CCR4-NOT transcription complex subunit 1